MGYRPGTNRKSSAPKGGKMERPAFGAKAPAVLAAYYPAGTHEVTDFVTKVKKLQDKIILCWEMDLPDSKGQQFRIFEVQTDSFYASAKLKLRVEALLGRPMTKAEQEGDFDMDTALGRCAMMKMTPEDPDKRGGPYIDKVDELQDQNVRVVVRHEYDVLPRYVKKVLASAEEGTVPGIFGAVIDGEVFFGKLPQEEEQVERKDEPTTEREPGDDSEEIDGDETPF